MQRTKPTVKGGWLYQSESDSDSIGVGTPAWYDWLEHHATFTFVDRVGTFTARKSMLKTRDSYWKAYRKHQGKLYRIHLGYSHTLTLERLQAAARAFTGELVAEDEPGEVSSTQPVASRIPSPRIAINTGNYVSLMQTKLYPPRSRSDMISRARLIERLNEGLSGNITLVCAPAGFGKTTLLTEWLQTIDHSTAWLSLDEKDDELRITSDRAAFFERLRHYPDRSVSSYLVEEILSQQTPTVQVFLERTSMLDQFCAELCAAILDSDASHGQMQATLDWLERSNLFLVPLDKRQGWYRFHHLFQQLLQRQLQTHTSEDEIAVLHRRASAWYVEQGLIEQALEHALAAGDMSSATQLVEAQFLPAFKQEWLAQMEHWLRLLPEEQIQGSPVLLVARVWILQAHGQLKDLPRLLTAAERLLATNGSDMSDLDNLQSRVLRGIIATWWSDFQYFTGQTQASLESARSALEWIPPGEEYIANLPLMFLAWSYQAIGNEDVALVALQQALTDHSLHVNIAARLLFAQGCVYMAAGKLHQVEHTARHLLHIAQEGDLVLSQHFAHWLLGVVYYERNDLDMAVYHFSVVIANQHQAHFWVVQDAMHGLALTYEAKRMSAQAQETARALLELMQRQHNIPELLTTYAFCGWLALFQNEVESAEQWLELAGDQEALGPMMFLEDPPITKAHLLLAKGDAISVAQGQMLLTHLLQYVQARHNTRKTIKVLALQAWAYDLQGRLTEALDVLECAFALARPGGFIRMFADIPSLVRLLHELRKRRKARHEVNGRLDTYLQRVLVAMSPLAAPSMSKEDLLQQEGLEPLTDREMQILHLLDMDLTNKEIARELVVTPGTVKVHTNNVYRKLSVNNRRAAVTLAKALGFLAPDQAQVAQWH